ncbi:hypothetical protein T07_7987 [Trichinella nelsoni]|uniref:Uncharacterized protein n=1 Tax=Trichinella nelsoni TaxID=6336 RepID=A0A0V0S893_9BILA|nr:hypothetical protein T07_7987 [Trichinella nelsoni]
MNFYVAIERLIFSSVYLCLLLVLQNKIHQETSFRKCCMIVDNAASSKKDSLYIHQLVHIPNFLNCFLSSGSHLQLFCFHLGILEK